MKIAVVAVLGVSAFILPGQGATILYTSSADYFSAVAGFNSQIQENFGSGFSDGQLIAPGTTINGITYSNFKGFTNADITSLYGSFTGLSLGADHTANGADQTFFYGGNSIDVTFSSPVLAVGAFFNVSLNSGSYVVATSVGTASVDSSAYDIGTFVFAGLISDTPFTTATLTSSDADLGAFNVTEIVAATAIPEPAVFLLVGLGLVTFGLRFRR